MKAYRILFSLLLVGCAAAELRAEVDEGLYFQQDAGMSCNQSGPNGFQLDSRLFWRKKSLSLFNFPYGNAKMDFGIQSLWSPADERLMLYGWLEPLPFLELKAAFGVQFLYNYLGFGFSPMSNFNSNPYSWTNSGVGENRWALWIEVTPAIKFRLGPVILKSSLTVNNIFVNGHDGYYLERNSFLVLEHDENYLTSDTSLLYEFDQGRYYFGVNYNLKMALISGKRYDRPSFFAVIKPVTEGLYDFYCVLMAGYLFGLNELYVAYSAGLTLKLI